MSSLSLAECCRFTHHRSQNAAPMAGAGRDGFAHRSDECQNQVHEQ